MNHNEAIRIESALKALNGSAWSHGADAIEAAPADTLRLGLLEHLLGGREKAEELDLIIRLSFDPSSYEEAAEYIVQLASSK